MTATATAHTLRGMSPRRWASTVIWAGGCWTTSLAVQSLAPDAPIGYIIGASIALQAGATAIESDIWNGNMSLFSLLVLLVDVLINAGGTWTWISRIDATPAWTMLVDGLGAPQVLGDIPKLGIAMILGVLLAYAPEAIWRRA